MHETLFSQAKKMPGFLTLLANTNYVHQISKQEVLDKKDNIEHGIWSCSLESDKISNIQLCEDRWGKR